VLEVKITAKFSVDLSVNIKLTSSSDNAVRVYDSNVTIMQPNVSVNGPVE
jgi:hypothetical protein